MANNRRLPMSPLASAASVNSTIPSTISPYKIITKYVSRTNWPYKRKCQNIISSLKAYFWFWYSEVLIPKKDKVFLNQTTFCKIKWIFNFIFASVHLHIQTWAAQFGQNYITAFSVVMLCRYVVSSRLGWPGLYRVKH